MPGGDAEVADRIARHGPGDGESRGALQPVFSDVQPAVCEEDNRVLTEVGESPLVDPAASGALQFLPSPLIVEKDSRDGRRSHRPRLDREGTATYGSCSFNLLFMKMGGGSVVG